MSEVGNISIDEARALVADQRLWPLARDFLWDFAPSVHRSWTEELGIPAPSLNSPRVKRYILDSLGVEPCFHFFPKEDGSRLLLLDGATLLEIAKWLGALSFADALRRVTSGKAVRALKAALPGVYPDVFGYSAYFRGIPQRGDAEAEQWDVAVVEEGCSLLFAALSKAPAPVVSRLKFKLPKALRVSDSPRGIEGGTIRKLLKLRFPEAHSLCC